MGNLLAAPYGARPDQLPRRGVVVVARFQDHRLRAAALLLLWGLSGVIGGAVPDLSTNRDHLMLYWLSITFGVALALLTVAFPDNPAAARLAALVEGFVGGGI